MKIKEAITLFIVRVIANLVYYFAPIIATLVVGAIVGAKAISAPCVIWAEAGLQVVAAVAIVYVGLRILIKVLFGWAGLDDLILFF